MRKRRIAVAVLLVCLGTALPAAAADSSERAADYDPIEKVNRKIFWFNDHADMYVLEPVARAWHWTLPDPVETSLSNFFSNLRFPVVMTNDLLQGKLKPAAVDVSRFMVNTTFGVAGFFDPATGWGLVRHNEDFGQTLGWWGVGPGPYLVLPVFGPSNPRDTGGLVVDYVLSVYPVVVSSWALTAAGAVNAINTRAQILQEVRDAKQASLDYYVFVRNAYYQRRRALVNDQQEDKGHPPTDDLYDLTGIEDTN
jgi:phospholipid-binding lipoprotein MlaA